MVIQCDECDKWRLIFSRQKLQPDRRRELHLLLADISYTCGVKFADLDLPEHLQCVQIREHQCSDGIEKLYYSAYPSDIIYCASTVEASRISLRMKMVSIHSVLIVTTRLKFTKEEFKRTIIIAMVTFFLQCDTFVPHACTFYHSFHYPMHFASYLLPHAFCIINFITHMHFHHPMYFVSFKFHHPHAFSSPYVLCMCSDFDS